MIARELGGVFVAVARELAGLLAGLAEPDAGILNRGDRGRDRRPCPCPSSEPSDRPFRCGRRWWRVNAAACTGGMMWWWTSIRRGLAAAGRRRLSGGREPAGRKSQSHHCGAAGQEISTAEGLAAEGGRRFAADASREKFAPSRSCPWSVCSRFPASFRPKCRRWLSPSSSVAAAMRRSRRATARERRARSSNSQHVARQNLLDSGGASLIWGLAAVISPCAGWSGGIRIPWRGLPALGLDHWLGRTACARTPSCDR